jgi:hypothetical protein
MGIEPPQTWRPRNESAEDLRAETAAKAIIERAWKCDILKLGEYLYGVDWSLSRDDWVMAFGEFKKRSRLYDTVILSAAKYEHGMRLGALYLVPFFFFVEIDGVLRYCDLRGQILPAKVGGNARKQNGDIEPCVFIPVNLFRIIPRAIADAAA